MTKKKYDSGYKPEENQEYQKAAAELQAARQQKPQYNSPYQAQTEDLYRKLQDRAPFSYDIDTDALYRQYRDQYKKQGSLAMEDTLGRAQAMTGGYGNSYAQSAAQQTYQGYLGRLNEQLPQLYASALERYRQEGQALESSYARAQGMEQSAYARHKVALDAYRKDIAQLQTQADQAWDRGYQSYLEGYKMQQDQYDRLIYLMEKRGYRPTKQELLELGFTEAQAAALGK